MKTAKELKRDAERMYHDPEYKEIKHIRYSFTERELEEYAEQRIREELMHFMDYQNNGYDHEVFDSLIDEYLKQKK